MSTDELELLAAEFRFLRQELKLVTGRRVQDPDRYDRMLALTTRLGLALLDTVLAAAATAAVAHGMTNSLEFHVSTAAPRYAMGLLLHTGRLGSKEAISFEAPRLAAEQGGERGIPFARALDLVHLGSKHFLVDRGDGLAWPIGLPDLLVRDLLESEDRV